MIKFDHVTYVYNPGTVYEKKALDNINLEIKDGEIVGLIGKSGSGKSTLVKNLSGLLKPTYGKIIIENQNKNPKKIGYVFQYPENQIFETTVFNEIGFAIKNLPEPQKKEMILNAMSSVGLPSEYLNKNPFELSGGEKRKVALASVFVMHPEILILDEPTVGLDFKTQQNILEYIKKIFNKKKLTVIIISHDMNIISEFTEKAIVLDSGKIIFYGETYKAFDFIKTENIPDTKKLANLLNAGGFEIPDNIIKFDDMAKFIAQKLIKINT